MGFIFQVDLRYPPEKKQYFDDFPPCCEKKSVPASAYSKFMRETLEATDSKPSKQEKLVSDLHEKRNYRVHYLNLVLLLSIGLQLVKVHRVVKFRQTAFLAQFIQFNNGRRKQSLTSFEKNFW